MESICPTLFNPSTLNKTYVVFPDNNNNNNDDGKCYHLLSTYSVTTIVLSFFPFKDEGIEPGDAKWIRSELAQDLGFVISKAFALSHVPGDFMTLSLLGERGEPALDYDMGAVGQPRNVSPSTWYSLNNGSTLI